MKRPNRQLLECAGIVLDVLGLVCVFVLLSIVVSALLAAGHSNEDDIGGIQLLLGVSALSLAIGVVVGVKRIMRPKVAPDYIPTPPPFWNEPNPEPEQSRKETDETRKSRTPPPVESPGKNERYYAQIFGLSGKLTRTDLKKRYRTLVNQYHPDKVQHLGKEFQDLAEHKMKEINEAYEFFCERYQI